MLRPESAAEQRLRQDVRAWLQANTPDELRHLTFRPAPQEIMPWYRRLFERGWIAPHWPREHGGMGASPVEQVILAEEMALIGAPDIPGQGINQIGPLLIKFGSPAQRALHLPRILSGEVIWCQGYSEPGAGSDLASLRTRARLEGDELVVNGHKTWTTWGHHAHWMYALARSGNSGSGGARSRHEGISFVLIDLATPGITRRPIRNIAGDDEFCEVFLDEVRVPVANVVGEFGAGWRVATALLNEERIRIGSPLLALKALARLHAAAKLTGAAQDPWMQERIAQAEIEVETLVAAFLDALDQLDGGGDAASASACLKVLATETVQRVLDAAQEAAGGARALLQPLTPGAERIDLSEMYLQSRRLSIYGGSNEIQRSLIASRVLGLPGGRRKPA